jgi:predicted metalloprotease
MSTGSKIGFGGIGGLIIAGLITLLMGGNIGDVLQQAGGMAIETGNGQPPTQEEEELATFSKQVIASTEDIWAQIFKEYGIGQYPAPTLVLYTGSTSTACGQGQAAMGPFYCSGDQKVYLDLGFFETMDRQLGVKGDNSSLAKAYVIAHEVGHHIEYLMGTLDQAHRKMQATNQTNANKYSVRLELMADFYAGIWAHYEKRYFNSITDQDLMEAIDCAQKIGDDYLQKRSQGYASPESFTHGTSAQRMKWFKLGYETGDVRRATTFQESDATL